MIQEDLHEMPSSLALLHHKWPRGRPFVHFFFRYSQTEQNEGALAREDKPRAKTIPVNRREQILMVPFDGILMELFLDVVKNGAEAMD